MSRQPKRAATDRTADEIAELWQSMADGQTLYVVIRSGRRDIPVRVSIGEAGHGIVVIGYNKNDPFKDFALLARLLIEGRRITKAGYMGWADGLARDAAVWNSVKRMERTCRSHGYVDAWDEFQHVTGRKRRAPSVDPAVFERVEAELKGGKS